MGITITPKNPNDLGQVCTLVGPANGPHTNLEQDLFVPGATFYADRKDLLQVPIVYTPDGTTNLTSITVKLQAFDGANWQDIFSTRQSSGVAAVEHSITNAQAGAVLQTANHRGMKGQRLMVKAIGGLTKAGDTVTATGLVD